MTGWQGKLERRARTRADGGPTRGLRSRAVGGAVADSADTDRLGLDVIVERAA